MSAVNVKYFHNTLKRKGLEQLDMVKSVNWSASKVSRVLNGKKKIDVDEARVIADFMQEPIEVVLHNLGVKMDLCDPTAPAGAQNVLHDIQTKHVYRSGRIEKADRELPRATGYNIGERNTQGVYIEDGPFYGMTAICVMSDSIDSQAFGRLCFLEEGSGNIIIATLLRHLGGDRYIVKMHNNDELDMSIYAASPIEIILP